MLKVASATFLVVWFVSRKDTTCETRENVLISSQKLFSLSRKSKFIVLVIQISWHHQMPKYKKNIFLNHLGSELILLMKFDQFISCYQRNNFIKKSYKDCDLKTSSRTSSNAFCFCKELITTSIEKWNFWSKLLILDM